MSNTCAVTTYKLVSPLNNYFYIWMFRRAFLVLNMFVINIWYPLSTSCYVIVQLHTFSIRLSDYVRPRVRLPGNTTTNLPLPTHQPPTITTHLLIAVISEDVLVGQQCSRHSAARSTVPLELMQLINGKESMTQRKQYL